MPECAQITSFIRENFWDYVSEFGPCGRALSRKFADERVINRIGVLCDLSQSHSIVVFSKPGCGYCRRALELLRTHGEVYDEPSNDAISRLALKTALEVTSITFPVIVIEGEYYGGLDDITVFLESNSNSLPIRSEAAPKSEKNTAGLIPHSESIRKRDSKPLLLQPPRGKAPYCFQLYVYSNLIRWISFVHIAVLVASIYTPVIVTRVLIGIMCVDLLLFVLLGCTPWAPIQTCLLWMGWKQRGGTATSIPYKVVFTIYLVALGRRILFNSEFKTEDARDAVKYMIGNSALLAVLRF